MAVAGESLHRGEQPPRLVVMAGRELVMRALAGQQRPGPADAGAVEGPAILVLAVAVAVVALPARTARQIDLQQRGR